MRRGISRAALIGAIVGGGILLAAGAAMAVSGGGYSPSQQDCPVNADSNSAGQPKQPPNPVPGCHNFEVAVGSANGTGGGPGAPGDGCGQNSSGVGGTLVFDIYNPAGTTFTPALGTPDVAGLANAVQAGLYTYLGADDNLDAGEHDGVDGKNGTSKMYNGPSDGGAITTHVSPNQATTAPSLTNPVPVAGASEGSCADNVCEEVTTQQQSVYQGGQKGTSRNVYDYSGKHWDPYNCSSGSPQDEQQCDDPNTAGTTETMNTYRQQEAGNVYAEPGVQVYGDPDPQSSPIDPLYEAGVTPQPTLYPLPSAYAGTCGAAANGQVLVNTGC